MLHVLDQLDHVRAKFMDEDGNRISLASMIDREDVDLCWPSRKVSSRRSKGRTNTKTDLGSVVVKRVNLNAVGDEISLQPLELQLRRAARLEIIFEQLLTERGLGPERERSHAGTGIPMGPLQGVAACQEGRGRRMVDLDILARVRGLDDLASVAVYGRAVLPPHEPCFVDLDPSGQLPEIRGLAIQEKRQQW